MEGSLELLVEPRRPSFLSYPSDLSRARAVIVGVPFDGGSTCKPGCRYAPLVVRAVSQDLETYDACRRIDADELPVADVGDLAATGVRAESMLKSASRAVGELVARGKRVVAIGGDHTITLGVLKGLGKRVSLVYFDAHLDYRDEYPPGERVSHATVLRRAVEGGLAAGAVVVGARAFSREEVEVAEGAGVALLGPEATPRDLEDALSTVSAPLYVSIDVDALDPAYAPGASCPEPGGFSFLQLSKLLERALEGEVVGADVVEVNPLADVNEVTSRVAAKLLVKCLIGLAARSP